MGRRHRLSTGHTGLGGTGSPAQGVVGVSLWAHGEAASSKHRAHRPGGDGESSPGGCPEPPARPTRGHHLQRPGRTGLGDWEPSPGGVRSLLQGLWGAIVFGELGAPAWGGRGVQPRGCSEPPARPMGGHHLRRTGRTGLGGTGSPAQGVFGASCKANGGPSSSENRAHRPRGDGEFSPGGVRSLL